MQQVLNLVKSEFILEVRRRSALGGILVYAFSTVFVTYLSVQHVLPAEIWSALIWIILLFISVNAAGKSFIQEQRGRMLYYFSHVRPQHFILGKLIYSMAFVTVLAVIVFAVFQLFFATPVLYPGWFMLCLVLGACGFAATINFMSSIAAAASGNFTMVSILSFPVLLPFLITQVKFSSLCMQEVFDTGMAWKFTGVLVLLNLMVVILSYVLFPYLWRD